MKNIKLKYFIAVFLALLKAVIAIEIKCNGKVVNEDLSEMLKSANAHTDEDCVIKLGSGTFSYPTNGIIKYYTLMNIKATYEIIGDGVDKTFFECPDNEKKSIFQIHSVTGKVIFKDLSFRNCGVRNPYVSAIKIEKSKNIYFENVEFYNMKTRAIEANSESSVFFDNIYVHDILYDSFNITNSVELDQGIINIESNSAATFTNSRLYGCPEECKNYNIYVSSGVSLDIKNCEFKKAAGGIYIGTIHTCNIDNSIFRDHDMALISNTKYKSSDVSVSPGALNGGAIHSSNSREFTVTNSEFINNAVNEQGGAIFMSLFNGNPQATFKNITFKNNFSYSEGRDLIVNGDSNVKVYLEDIKLTGGRDPRWTNDIKPSFMFLNKIEVKFENIMIKDFYSNGTIINIEQATNSEINNFSIENSIFDGILESQCSININKLKIKNSISQGGYADKKSLPAFNIKMNNVSINDAEVDGFSCKSTIFNVQSYGELQIKNAKFKDLYAKETIITRSYIGASDQDPTPLIIENCTFDGVSSSSSMFNLETGAWCKIKNSKFNNVGFCPVDNSVKNCDNADTGSFASLMHTAALDITDSEITNSKASNGGLFFIKHEPKLTLKNVTVTNSTATEYGGVFWFGDFGGSLNINDCNFNECKAEKGGVIAISRNSHLVRDESWKTEFEILFDGCEFHKNNAEYGAVFFIGENSYPDGITFKDSIFQDNEANAGGVGICINKTTIPHLINYQSINNKAIYYGDEFGYQPNQIDLLSVIAAHSSDENPIYPLTDFKNNTNYFPYHANIKYAKNFSVEYGNYTKIVTVGNESFLLIQEGADPSDEIIGQFENEKIIKIPVEKAGVYDRSVVPYIELLEKRSSIAEYKNIKTTTSYCVHYMFENESTEEYTPDRATDFFEQLCSTDIIFGIIDNEVTANNDDSENYYHNVPFNAISEETALARAEWIKYIALFYNEEKLAEYLFDLLEEDYSELKKVVNTEMTSTPKSIAWVSYDASSSKWNYLTSNFYRNLTEDANAKFISPSTSGTFLENIADADIIIDVSEPGVNDNINDFYKHAKLNEDDCNKYKFCKDNHIMRFDKQQNSYGFNPWNEHLLPMANLLLIELQVMNSPEVFNNDEIDIWYHPVYLRSIRDNQITKTSSNDCYDINSSVIYERFATTEELDIKTLSGDWIPYSFMLGIKTYNGTNFKSLNDETTTEGALFVTVIIVDKNNTGVISETSTIYGKKRWRCNLSNSTCSIPANEFQVIGNEGNYMLNFTIIENENWQFDTLISSFASVDITIQKCSRLLEKDITNTLLKSCYDPDCPGGCLHFGSRCVDLNTCQCAENWEGPNCNDRVKFVVPSWLQYMFLIIGITSAVLCCVLILMLYLRRNLQHVRSSSPLFLIIMTVGAVFNSGVIILESRNDSIPICILREWCKYIGFSLMVGALIVKTIRISLIFSGKKIGGAQLADKRLIFYLFGILIPFIILLTIWSTVDKAEMGTDEHAEKAFEKCKSHTTSIIGDVFLFAILFWAVHAAYTARNAPSAFNETKAIVLSTYVYFIIEVLVIVLQNLGSFDPTVSMTINCLATLVSTWCCLLFILKPKMKNVASQMTPSQYSTNSQSQSEAYNSTVGTASMGTTSVGAKTGRL